MAFIMRKNKWFILISNNVICETDLKYTLESPRHTFSNIFLKIAVTKEDYTNDPNLVII